MQSVTELLTAAVSDRDDDARWSAIESLQRLGSRDVFDHAVSLCHSATPRERATGAEVLAQLGGSERPFRDETMPILSTLLGDGESSVVASAIQAMGQLGGDYVIEPITRLAAHGESNVRWAVASALAEVVEDERAVRVLLALTRDDDGTVRDAATFAIGSLCERDSPAIRAALVARLEDAEPTVVREAQLGLARRHDRRVIPHVVRAVEAGESDMDEIVDEITLPQMLPALLDARDAVGDRPALKRLIDEARRRADE